MKTELPNLEKCVCDSAGNCTLLNKYMGGRNFQLCNGRGDDLPPELTPELQKKYRQAWLEQSTGLARIEGSKPAPIQIRIKTFMMAIAEWVKAGRPIRSPEEQKRIFELCKKCVWYSPKLRQCTACGCSLDRQGFEWAWGRWVNVLTAIKLATKKCPKNLW